MPYVQWIREGLIEATPGEVIDYDRIRRRLNELAERYDVREIAIDRWNATQLATQLTDDGFEIVAFGQGYASMNWPTKKLEELVLGCRLARSSAITRATMPSMRSGLGFLEGFQLSAASVSIETLPAIQRSTGWPPWASRPPRTNSSSFFVGQFMLA